MTRRPEVVREKVSRTAEGHLSCALIFDREFHREEVQRFYTVPSDSLPGPTDFEIAGRVLRYDCQESDEARWRLAAEIFLVKSFQAAPKRRSLESDARHKLGLRPLHR
ncbi:MAG: hypothetical protein ABI968_13045 [Acidobacteriota bacterium]